MARADTGQGMMRAQFRAEIDRLGDKATHHSAGQLAARVDALRRQARDHGLIPLSEIAFEFERALANRASPTLLSAWIDSLRDALDCDAGDRLAGRVLLAAVGQRLHG